MQQLRQPRGVPEGGEFAAHARDDAVIELTTDEPAAPEQFNPTYRIKRSALSAFQGRVRQANARLARAGIAERFEISAEATVENDPKTGLGVELLEVTLNRPTIGQDGWKFAGAFDTTPNGDMIAMYRSDSDVPTPEDFHCDQCGASRRRERIYVLRHDDGNSKQVGKSCIAPVLGVHPRGLWALEWEPGLDEPDEDAYDDPEWSPHASTEDVVYPTTDLMAAAAIASDFGAEFVPRSRASMERPATADAVARDWNTLYEGVTDEHRAYARKVLDWVEAQPADSDYIGNVRAALGVGSTNASRWVRRKHLGIAVSAISAYRRDQEREVREAEEKKERASFAKGFLGEPKDKLDGLAAKVLRTRSLDGDYGTRTMVELASDDGHVIVWWATGDRAFELGQQVRVRGTIKGHETYRDTDQTVITRAKITDPATGEVLG